MYVLLEKVFSTIKHTPAQEMKKYINFYLQWQRELLLWMGQHRAVAYLRGVIYHTSPTH